VCCTHKTFFAVLRHSSTHAHSHCLTPGSKRVQRCDWRSTTACSRSAAAIIAQCLPRSTSKRSPNRRRHPRCLSKIRRRVAFAAFSSCALQKLQRRNTICLRLLVRSLGVPLIPNTSAPVSRSIRQSLSIALMKSDAIHYCHMIHFIFKSKQMILCCVGSGEMCHDVLICRLEEVAATCQVLLARILTQPNPTIRFSRCANIALHRFEECTAWRRRRAWHRHM
jgi:hypothetical protein